MVIARGNKRLPVTLNVHRQKSLLQLKKKYSKSETKLLCIALVMLVEEEKLVLKYQSWESDTTLFLSPLEIFSGIDETGYKLAKNAIDVRLNFY